MIETLLPRQRLSRNYSSDFHCCAFWMAGFRSIFHSKHSLLPVATRTSALMSSEQPSGMFCNTQTLQSPSLLHQSIEFSGTQFNTTESMALLKCPNYSCHFGGSLIYWASFHLGRWFFFEDPRSWAEICTVKAVGPSQGATIDPVVTISGLSTIRAVLEMLFRSAFPTRFDLADGFKK